MAKLRFTKMHGLGNDFVVLDGIRQHVDLTCEQRRLLANRRLGVGCDQILVIERPTRADADFRYRIYNAEAARSSSAATVRAACAVCARPRHTVTRRIRVETAGHHHAGG
jgi:diaminopimelate epimerase